MRMDQDFMVEIKEQNTYDFNKSVLKNLEQEHRWSS